MGNIPFTGIEGIDKKFKDKIDKEFKDKIADEFKDEIDDEFRDEIFPKTGGTNIDVAIEKENANIFFFGCWNNIDNKTIISQIIDDINKKETDFGIINGDNLYKTVNPENTKEKKYNLSNIQKGFNIIKKYEKPIYLTLGNHELDNPKMDKNVDKIITLEQQVEIEKAKCIILKKEKTVSKGTNLYMEQNYYSITLTSQNNIKIIFLDTNLCENNQCYVNEELREIEKEKMFKWLDNILVANVEKKPIIIIGHAPLFYKKEVKEPKEVKEVIEVKVSDTVLEKVKKLIVFTVNPTTLGIYQILQNYKFPIYYFASHVHNYQYIIDQNNGLNIHMIINGTGGAKLDDLDLENDKIINHEEKTYIFDKFNKNHGYSIITITNNNVLHKFFDITKKDMLSGGYKANYNKIQETGIAMLLATDPIIHESKIITNNYQSKYYKKYMKYKSKNLQTIKFET